MDLGIAGRRAIVAGGSAGLGGATAVALAREGVELVVAARGEDRLLRKAERIREETGAKVTTVCCDHGTAAGRAALRTACPDPDILVITRSPPRTTDSFREIGEEEWAEAFATSMVGAVELMRQFIDGMCDRRFGRIVNIATLAAKQPAEFRLLSGPPRSALVNYTAVVARKVARHNVIMNNLLPGFYLTEAQETRFRAAAAEQGVTYEAALAAHAARWRIPTRGLGDPDGLGAFAAMMCSQHAGFLVGQSLTFDGGMTTELF